MASQNGKTQLRYTAQVVDSMLIEIYGNRTFNIKAKGWKLPIPYVNWSKYSRKVNIL